MMDAPMFMTKELNIDDLGAVMLEQLKADGWSIDIETDYPCDLKEYYASSADSNAIFPRLTVLLLTLDNNPENYDIRFIFYANPAQIKTSKRVFGRILRKKHIAALQEAAETLLHNSKVSVKREEMTVDAKPKYKLKFDCAPAISPAYAVQFHYCKQSVSSVVAANIAC